MTEDESIHIAKEFSIFCRSKREYNPRYNTLVTWMEHNRKDSPIDYLVSKALEKEALDNMAVIWFKVPEQLRLRMGNNG